MLTFDNSYARLPAHLYTKMPPQPVPDPAFIALNEALLRELGGDPESLRTRPDLFSGNALFDGADPLAQAYGGHQFGHWNPGLGDGRALLLGEVVTDMNRYDLQLKGSGRTPYSRQGDGKAAIGPVIREYIMSEALHALGVPTTRALAAVTTGEMILREGPEPGAILTRLAASHIRVGTFQLQAYRGDIESLRALYEHTLARHFKGCETVFDVTRAMMTRQSDLIAKWMSLGFIHGVMNTDNMTVSGETIDYGPCAFMDSYHPATVFSSIDRQGRYAYANQPQIAIWNIAQFASSLVPLAEDQDAAVDRLNTMLEQEFQPIWQAAWSRHFAAKLGLPAGESTTALAHRLLKIMTDTGADFTNTFADLTQPIDHPDHAEWLTDWASASPDLDAAAQHNPKTIPRLHLIAQAISQATSGDLTAFHALLDAVTDPFTAHEGYCAPPQEHERVTATFCGT